MEAIVSQQSQGGQTPQDSGQAKLGSGVSTESGDGYAEESKEPGEVVDLREKAKRLEALVTQVSTCRAYT